MKKTIIALSIASASITAMPVMAASSDAMSTFGIQAQESDLDINAANIGQNTNEYGVFYNYGNKMTGSAGYIYEFKGNAGWGSDSNVDTTVYDLGADVGYRHSLDRSTFADVVGGLGYEYLEEEADGSSDSTEIKLPYFKAGVALGTHFNSENTGRLEVGTRFNFNAEAESGDTNIDIDEGNNLYAEVAWLNTSTGVPLETSLFYRKGDVTLEGQNSVDIDRDITGVRFGVKF